MLAIDVGGTATRAVVLDASGDSRGYGAAGAGNPTSASPADAADAIGRAARTAAEAAGVELANVAAAVAGIAGAGGARGAALLDRVRHTEFPIELELAADLHATYLSGALEPSGYAMVVGTGAIAGRIEHDRIVALCDGAGWLVGDDGSGFWIGRRVVASVVAALDGRRQPTSLVDALLGELEIPFDPDTDVIDAGRRRDLQALLEVTYRLRPVELARFARLAFDAAATGDEEAAAIVDDAAAALSVTAAAIADRDVPGPIVLGGSILAQQPSVANRIVDSMRAAGIDGTVTTVADGLVGAAVLALRRGDVEVDAAMLDRIRSTLDALR